MRIQSIGLLALAIGMLDVGCGTNASPMPALGTGGSKASVGGGSAQASAGTTSSVGGSTTASGHATGGLSARGGTSGGGTVSGGSGASTGGTSQSTGGSLGTTGGTAAGGTGQNTGGGSTGGKSTGGNTQGTGGTTQMTGGNGSGGKSTGGANSGGTGAASTGGGSTGGTATGGGSTGGAASGGVATGGSTHTGVWKVMALGDSITAGYCYPQLVSKDLITAGHTNFELIGTQLNSASCGATSVLTEGHGGYGVTYLPQDSTRSACTKSTGCGSYAELQAWAAELPDIVLMHYGTNDVWDGQSASSILSAYVSVINEFRKQNPNVIFFVSKIIKLNPSGCTACLTNVAALAAAVTDSWASTNSTATSPIHIVDNYNCGFDPSNTADSTDGVHPTLAGSQKMATVTVDAVIAQNYF